MRYLFNPLFVVVLGLGALCQGQATTTTPPTGTITTPVQTTSERYFLNDCPNATGAGFALCALSRSEEIWISEGPCQGAATKGDDDVFSSCYCRMMVEWGPYVSRVSFLFLFVMAYPIGIDRQLLHHRVSRERHGPLQQLR